MKINTKVFNKIISSVFLGGVVEEAIINFERDGGNCFIHALDRTSCIFISAAGKVGCDEDISIGVDSIGVLSKTLSSIDSEVVEVEFEDEWIVINIENRGRAKIRLIESNLVPTSVENADESMDAMLAGANYSIPISEKSVSDFLFFMGLFKNASTVFEVSGGKLILKSGPNETKSFSTVIGKINEKKTTNFSVTVFGEFLSAVFKELTFDSKVVISVGPDSPVIIQSGENFNWFLTPSVSIEE